MTKEEFFQVLECFVLYVEEQRETQARKEYLNDVIFETDDDDLPF